MTNNPFTKQWNPMSGCSIVSTGCVNCTAKKSSKLLSGRFGYSQDDPFEITLHSNRLEQPLRWKKPQRIEVCDMGDLFHPTVTTEYIASVFAVMAACPQHTFFVSTKYVERAKEWFEWVYIREADGRDMFPHDSPSWRIWQMLRSYAGKIGCSLPPHHGGKWPLPNVWMGTSVETQHFTDRRLPILTKIPAAGHFVQVAPMLRPIELKMNMWELDWVICSGELGKEARPLHPTWVDDLQEECSKSKVPFFFTGWGEWGLCNGEHPDDKGVRVKLGLDGKNASTDERAFGIPGDGNGVDALWLGRFGVRHTGRLIGGKECSAIPERVLLEEDR